jgi:hypothetical protein
MSRRFLAGFACTVALATSVRAQAPQQPASPAAQTAASAQANIVIVEGCILKEGDVPGRRPPDELRSRAVTGDRSRGTSRNIY